MQMTKNETNGMQNAARHQRAGRFQIIVWGVRGAKEGSIIDMSHERESIDCLLSRHVSQPRAKVMVSNFHLFPFSAATMGCSSWPSDPQRACSKSPRFHASLQSLIKLSLYCSTLGDLRTFPQRKSWAKCIACINRRRSTTVRYVPP